MVLREKSECKFTPKVIAARLSPLLVLTYTYNLKCITLHGFASVDAIML